MTREEHLVFCKKCLNRKFDPNRGLICNISGTIADFEDSCENFQVDEAVKEVVVETPILTNEEKINALDLKSTDKLRGHQDFSYAAVGGSLAVLIGAIMWAVVTVATQYQIAYMAIGVGLLVGFSVQFFGAGIDQKFGYLGALLALLGCLLGNLFSQVGFIAQEQSLEYFETLSYLNPGLIIDILTESFSPIDLLFYGFAVYEGYKFAFRRVSAQEIKDLQSDSYHGYPANSNLRLPLVIVSVVLIGVFLFTIRQGVSGMKTFNYESGNRMSEGELKNSKEHGKWTYWYENGETQLTGFYNNGLPDSLWQWFGESGNLMKIGNYKNGLEHGVWINYYENGIASDSGSYLESRMNGEWKYRFENGNLSQVGNFNRNIQDGVWQTYYENGQLSSKGEMKDGKASGLWTNYFETGQAASNILYLPDDNISIKEAWDKDGNQMIQDGNGLYQSFSDSGQLILKGNVENGLRVGDWITYFENGKISEEGTYENDIYLITNSWDINGEPQIIKGNGTYKSFYPESESVLETGKIENGLREGEWLLYHQSSDNVFQDVYYSKGKLTGPQKIYFESGQLYSVGESIDDSKEGEWTWYYENGNLSSVVSFIKDKKEGKQTLWSETGEKTKEEYYENGELTEEKLFNVE